jgi:hypothetical protein
VEGPGLVARLHDALEGKKGDAIVIFPSSLAGESQIPSPLAGEGAVDGGSQVRVLAVPITDTCKEVTDEYVRRTVPRDTLVDARGPWMFPRELLVEALERVSGRDISTLVDLSRAARLDVRVTLQR